MLIDKAVAYAAKAHEGMIRKGFNQPYIFHPLEVLSLVSLMSDDDDVLCAAMLHDTVEDTPVSIDDIAREFNEHIARLVGYETEDKRGQVDKEGTWVERKQETIDTIGKIDDLGGKMICLADKVSNLRSMHLGLMESGDDFWELFNMKDPLMHYWYFNEIKNQLSELKDSAVYKEYCFLIDAVFAKYLKEVKHE